MIATCQFCQQMIVGPESSAASISQSEFVEFEGALYVAQRAREVEYRKLSLLVSAHMVQWHREDAGRSVEGAMALAGAAMAMRFVASSDAAVDAEREKAGRLLVEQFTPKPPGPLVSLA